MDPLTERVVIWFRFIISINFKKFVNVIYYSEDFYYCRQRMWWIFATTLNSLKLMRIKNTFESLLNSELIRASWEATRFIINASYSGLLYYYFSNDFKEYAHAHICLPHHENALFWYGFDLYLSINWRRAINLIMPNILNFFWLLPPLDVKIFSRKISIE